MRKLIVFVAMLALVGCGGSGSDDDPSSTTNTPLPSTSAGLPSIIDNVADGVFKYTDVSLYKGTYELPTMISETCSAYFGETMPNSVQVFTVDQSSLIYIMDGKQYTYPGYTQTSYDSWTYEGLYSLYSCVFTLTTINSEDKTETRDVFAIACSDKYSYASCSIGYAKKSNYNFTSTAIKHLDKDDGVAFDVDVFKANLDNLWLEVYQK